MNVIRVALAVTVAAALATAQSPISPVSCEIVPNPVPVGSTSAEIRLFNNLPNSVGHGPCNWYALYRSLPDGRPDLASPIRGPLIACPAIYLFTSPGQEIGNSTPISQWDLNDGGVPVGPGRYWVRTNVYDTVAGVQVQEWFPLRVVAPGEPTMTTTVAPIVGSTASYAVSVPAHPSAACAVLLGFRSSNPPGALPALGIDLALDLPFFDVSGPLILDPAGDATFNFQIANQPFLAQESLVLQTVFISTAPPPLLGTTNAVCNSIR